MLPCLLPWDDRATNRSQQASVAFARELCDGCFQVCKSLRRVTFGCSSSLEWIRVSCFKHSGVGEVRIPDDLCELCDRCFQGCESLRRVMFGSSSCLERVGRQCFRGCGLVEIIAPDGVRQFVIQMEAACADVPAQLTVKIVPSVVMFPPKVSSFDIDRTIMEVFIGQTALVMHLRPST